jgi:large subunit ribosomal protein L17
MRKKVYGKQLSRGRKSRTALRKSLIRAMVLDGKIKTTRAKAKVIQPELERIMTLVSQNNLSARRAVLAKLGNDSKVTAKIWADYLEFAKARKSGFVKSTLLPRRKGDNAELAILEWLK